MSTSLFVGNIPYGAMEKEIAEVFAACGEVEEVRFIMDHRKGRFRGFGFVRMRKADATTALERLDGTEFQGRRLKVRLAQRDHQDALRSA